MICQQHKFIPHECCLVRLKMSNCISAKLYATDCIFENNKLLNSIIITSLVQFY